MSDWFSFFRRGLKRHTCKICWQKFPDKASLLAHSGFAPAPKAKKRGFKK